MHILPAIDIKDRRCVRLLKGDFATVHQVAEDPLQTAYSFKEAGASWIHMVDLDGAKTGEKSNADIFEQVAAQSGLKVELGGGIRSMEALDFYFNKGVARCILGSAALKNPDFVREAVKAYGNRVAVGIDALNGLAAAEGWLEVSSVPYIELARRMENMGVQTLIFTDISKDGTLAGPNLDQLDALSRAVSCNIIASGGIRELEDIKQLRTRRLYGAICGKSLYSGTLNLSQALAAAQTKADGMELERFFEKAPLLPAVVQEESTGQVLMLAYMNLGALQRTIETGTTWFWSRSRREYWNKGATSGHVQQVVSLTGDCDSDTLLVRVNQTGAACHTGSHSCFFDRLL